jgi:hypothetical protein
LDRLVLHGEAAALFAELAGAFVGFEGAEAVEVSCGILVHFVRLPACLLQKPYNPTACQSGGWRFREHLSILAAKWLIC